MDPRGVADLYATHEDQLIPSSCFTAPDTLGFSRAFVTDPEEMMKVYLFPKEYIRENYLRTWMQVLDTTPAQIHKGSPCTINAPPGAKIHVNEVVRAAVNRIPEKICIEMSREQAMEELKPLVMLCERRNIPTIFEETKTTTKGSIATVYFV